MLNILLLSFVLTEFSFDQEYNQARAAKDHGRLRSADQLIREKKKSTIFFEFGETLVFFYVLLLHVNLVLELCFFFNFLARTSEQHMDYSINLTRLSFNVLLTSSGCL